MVSISKIVLIGVGLVAATLFFKEAAATSLTGTLSRTGLAGAELGGGINKTLTGIGEGASTLLNPVGHMISLLGKAGDLFPGSPPSELGGGGGVNLNNNSGGGIAPNNIPSSLAGVSASNGGSTSSWTSAANKATAPGTFSKPSGWGI